MPKLELNFLPKIAEIDNATDEQLLLQFIYGHCGDLEDSREENSHFFRNFQGFPKMMLRRVLKIIVNKCNLPIPASRVDEWVEWKRDNSFHIISDDMSKEAKKLSELVVDK